MNLHQYKSFTKNKILSEKVLKTVDLDSSILVTKQKESELISQCLLALTMHGVSKNSTISDLTACVGGNTTNFAKHFYRVNSVEINKDRIEQLKININNLQIKNVNVICADCTDAISQIEQDIIFLDPLWDLTNGSLTLNKDTTVEQAIINIFRFHSKIIALKYPPEFDYELFQNTVFPFFHIYYYYKLFNKLVLIVLIAKTT